MSNIVKPVRKFLARAELLKKPLGNILKTYVYAGRASASPPLGPLLGKFGLNIANFCKDFNNKTSHIRDGIPIPIKVKVNPDRSYLLELYHPTEEYYLKQAAGVDYPRLDGNEVAGKITLKHIYEIAKLKNQDHHLFHLDLDEVCKHLIKKAQELGIEVVRDITPEELHQFRTERKARVEQHKQELLEAHQARMERIAKKEK